MENRRRGRPGYSPGVDRTVMTVSVTSSTAALLRQWARIFRDEYEKQYPKDEGHWPRGPGEIIEEALEVWLSQMHDFECAADPVGFREHAETLGPLKEDMHQARYATGTYFEMMDRMDRSPLDFDEVRILFEGEEEQSS